MRVMECCFFQSLTYKNSWVRIGNVLGLPIFVVCDTEDSGADDAIFMKMYVDNLELALQGYSITFRFMVEGTLSLKWPISEGFGLGPTMFRVDVKRYISVERLKVEKS